MDRWRLVLILLMIIATILLPVGTPNDLVRIDKGAWERGPGSGSRFSTKYAKQHIAFYVVSGGLALILLTIVFWPAPKNNKEN